MPGRDSTIRLFLAPPRRLFLHNHYLQSFGLHHFIISPCSVVRGPIAPCLFEVEFGCAWSFRFLCSFSPNSPSHNHYRQHLFSTALDHPFAVFSCQLFPPVLLPLYFWCRPAWLILCLCHVICIYCIVLSVQTPFACCRFSHHPPTTHFPPPTSILNHAKSPALTHHHPLALNEFDSESLAMDFMLRLWPLAA